MCFVFEWAKHMNVSGSMFVKRLLEYLNVQQMTGCTPSHGRQHGGRPVRKYSLENGFYWTVICDEQSFFNSSGIKKKKKRSRPASQKQARWRTTISMSWSPIFLNWFCDAFKVLQCSYSSVFPSLLLFFKKLPSDFHLRMKPMATGHSKEPWGKTLAPAAALTI